MKTGSVEIRFKKDDSKFFDELNAEVQLALNPSLLSKADSLIRIKLAFYASLFVGFYALLYTPLVSSSFGYLTLTYCLFGLSGILLAFNSSHDAVHNTLFKSKKANQLTHYMVFNLQGVNARLWKKRHLFSHHLFPNVDGCDADIDDNPFIRLSKSQKLKRFHKYQHIYAAAIYCLYTLHWIFVKDFIYLNKNRVANMTNLSYSKKFIFETVVLKIIYLAYTIGLPAIFTDFSTLQVIAVFLIMHFFISLFFVLTLIISHLTLETSFPVVDEAGMLPFTYSEHQLAVSVDYHPTSKLANWIFGGFNSHSAHHLFPNMKHTLYTYITPCIQKVTKQKNMRYNELSMIKAIWSHFLYLKELGVNNSSNSK